MLEFILSGSFLVGMIVLLSWLNGKKSVEQKALREANRAMQKGNKKYAKISEASRLATQRGINSVRNFLKRKKP